MIRLTTDTGLALTISLALALSAYRGAVALDISGPIAVVTAGLVLAYALNRDAKTKEWLTGLLAFWPSVDELLNTLLYLLIGAEVLATELSWQVVVAMLVAIPLALLTRLLRRSSPVDPAGAQHRPRDSNFDLGRIARRHLDCLGADPAAHPLS